MGVVRDLVKRSLAGDLGSRLAAEVDNLTTRLGAQPIRGPVFGGAEPRSARTQESPEPKESVAPEYNRMFSGEAGPGGF